MGHTTTPESDTSQLERRNRELAILNTIAQALNREVDLELTLRTALAQVADLLGLHTGWIWLLDEATGTPYLAAAQNLPPGLASAPERMEGSCYCLDSYVGGELPKAANINIITCSRLKLLVDGTDGLRYHASIPLYAHGKKLGVLNVVSADYHKLSADDLRLLYTVGDLVSIAIERARLFARSVDMGAVEERNRLAREIHDTLAQGLAGLVAQLQAARSAGLADRERHLDTASELARSTLVEARRSVQALRPEPLEAARLPDALAAVAGCWSEVSGVPATVTTTGTARQLHPEVEITLLRTGQEALANVGKHAGASRVGVTLSYMEDVVTLDVRDDGIGFDPAGLPEEAADGSGFGLTGMRQRVARVAGRLEIESAPGEGTAVSATVPAIPA